MLTWARSLFQNSDSFVCVSNVFRYRKDIVPFWAQIVFFSLKGKNNFQSRKVTVWSSTILLFLGCYLENTSWANPPPPLLNKQSLPERAGCGSAGSGRCPVGTGCVPRCPGGRTRGRHDPDRSGWRPGVGPQDATRTGRATAAPRPPPSGQSPGRILQFRSAKIQNGLSTRMGGLILSLPKFCSPGSFRCCFFFFAGQWRLQFKAECRLSQRVMLKFCFEEKIVVSVCPQLKRTRWRGFSLLKVCSEFLHSKVMCF